MSGNAILSSRRTQRKRLPKPKPLESTQNSRKLWALGLPPTASTSLGSEHRAAQGFVVLPRGILHRRRALPPARWDSTSSLPLGQLAVRGCRAPGMHYGLGWLSDGRWAASLCVWVRVVMRGERLGREEGAESPSSSFSLAATQQHVHPYH